MNMGLYDTMLQCLADYAAIVNSVASESTDVVAGADSEMIDTNGPAASQLENTYSHQTITLLISMLSQGCKHSNPLICKILDTSGV